jgi:putative hydrolase
MTGTDALLSDWHTHSNQTDGADSIPAMADAALLAGLNIWGLSDHVRASSDWLDEYHREVRALRRGDLDIRCGLETKLLNTAGDLDLPVRLPTLDYLLLADHQFPGESGPLGPSTVRAQLERGERRGEDVIADLITATVNGLAKSPFPPIVAHLFSLLPKMGLDESLVTDEHVDALAAACLANGGAVEINEKWRCPSSRVAVRLAQSGVPITCGTDAHSVGAVASRDYIDSVLAGGGITPTHGVGTQQALADEPRLS